MQKMIIYSVIFISTVGFLVPSARGVTFSPWAGYGTIYMNEANQSVDNEASSLQVIGSTCVVNGFNESYVAGFDVGIFRIGCIAPVPAKITSEFLGIKTDIETRSLLGMAMVGFRLLDPAESPVNIGVFGGYGYTMVGRTINVTEPIPLPVSEALYGGGAYIYEGVIGLKTGVIELNFGYRMARIPEVVALGDFNIDGDNDIDGNDVLKGEVLSDVSTGDPIVFDYTGMFVTLGIRFGGSPSVVARRAPPIGFRY